jgi:hypothetical protein
MNKKTIKSDIAYIGGGEKRLSENRIQVTYTYVYVDDFDAKRIMKKHQSERRKGWKQYDSDSIVVIGKKSHLWIYHGFWKATKPVKRIKMDD